MQKWLLISFILIHCKIGLAQKEVTVFESGKEGYAIFRIPSIVQLPNKKIFAFAEGRVNGGADFGNIKIVHCNFNLIICLFTLLVLINTFKPK